LKPLLAKLDYSGFDMQEYYNYKDEDYKEAMERFQKALLEYN
jgi:hypothetical protein